MYKPLTSVNWFSANVLPNLFMDYRLDRDYVDRWQIDTQVDRASYLPISLRQKQYSDYNQVN